MGYLDHLDKLRAQGLTITPRSEWGARKSWYTPAGASRSYTDSGRTIRLPARFLFLHIAVVDDPSDLVGDERQVMRSLERIGLSRFPNTGISYNAAAFDTGRIYEGQPLGRRGAHTVNDKGAAGFPFDLNALGHAIVLPQMESDDVTDEQVVAVASWGAALVRAGLNRAEGGQLYPHRRFAFKECPGDKAVARLPEMNSLLGRYIRDGLPHRPTPTPTPEDWFTMATKDDLTAALRALIPEIADAAAAKVWDRRVANTTTADPSDVTYLRNLIQDAAATGRLDAAASRDIAARLDAIEARLGAGQ